MAAPARIDHQVDLQRLLKLRLVVGRVGEVGLAGWWGTKDVLGPMGDMAYKRGFPRSHSWAQAKVVFEVARARCRERFPDPSAMTLWDLPAPVEEQFEHAWGKWMGEPEAWSPIFEQIKLWKDPNLEGALKAFDLWDEGMAAFLRGTKSAGGGLEVLAPDGLSETALGRLAVGFAAGASGEPVVPFLRLVEN